MSRVTTARPSFPSTSASPDASAITLSPRLHMWLFAFGPVPAYAPVPRSATPMKAAVLHAANQPLTIEEVELTKPQSREVLLRTAFAGLCHSDLDFIEGLYPHPTPCVLGHESAGIVEAVGDGLTYVKPGDHLLTCLSAVCGTFPQCVTGHPNFC